MRAQDPSRPEGPLRMTPTKSQAGSASADEMHDLQPVAFGKTGLIPLLPGDDVAVQFHRDAILLHAQLLDQSSKRECWTEAALFPVNDELHLHRFSQLFALGASVTDHVGTAARGCRVERSLPVQSEAEPRSVGQPRAEVPTRSVTLLPSVAGTYGWRCGRSSLPAPTRKNRAARTHPFRSSSPRRRSHQ